jgi:hypothetical protein
MSHWEVVNYPPVILDWLLSPGDHSRIIEALGWDWHDVDPSRTTLTQWGMENFYCIAFHIEASLSITIRVLSRGSPSFFSGFPPPRTLKISRIAAPWEGP